MKSIFLGMAIALIMATEGCEGTSDDDPVSDPGSSTSEPVSNENGTEDPAVIDTEIVEDPVIDPGLTPVSFAGNDVSILFPAPETSQDVSDTIIKLSDFSSDRVLTQSQFEDIITTSTGASMMTLDDGSQIPIDAGLIPGTTVRIKFPGENRRQDWALAGLRIDPGAPGLSQPIFDVFGRSPQIRLIFQPIREIGGTVRVTDGSLHLTYAFHRADDPSQTCRFHNVPDIEGFSAAVTDLLAIKEKMQSDHNISTDNVALGVHPAFESAGPEFKTEIREYLNTHLTTDRLFAASIAAIPLPNPEPWVFVALRKVPGTDRLEAVPSPATIQPPTHINFGQMISFLGTPSIEPKPATRNLKPIDCRANPPFQLPAPVPGDGVATESAFSGEDTDIVTISQIIADPAKSHFFNTDCSSCHSETRKEIDMGRNTIAGIAAQAHIDPDVIPKGQWNVRAYGWFPDFFDAAAPGAEETVTRRTATETEEVLVCFANGRWTLPDEACLP